MRITILYRLTVNGFFQISKNAGSHEKVENHWFQQNKNLAKLKIYDEFQR